MPEIKPLIINNPSTSDPSSARSDFKSKVGSSPIKKTYTKKGSSLANGVTDWKRVLAYALPGAGKTYALGSLALAGYKIVNISTDFGGNGLTTAFNLIVENDPSKLSNIQNVDLDDYDEVQEFTRDPTIFFPDLYSFDPDFLSWDGFSAFQQIHAQDNIADEMDGDGLKFGIQEWGKLRNSTLRTLNRFLNLHNAVTGKHWNKYVTCHRDKPKEDTYSNEKSRGPLIQGAAASFVPSAFDIMLEMSVKNKAGVTDDNARREYTYLTQPNANVAARSRGIKLESVEPADFALLWKKIESQMRLEAEKIK